MNLSLPKTINAYSAESALKDAQSWLAAWRWWLPPALLALVLALLFQDPFIGDWDGLDYTVLALSGQPSSMALGRSLFIYSNHALYSVAHTIFHLAPEDAYKLFKYTVIAESPLAIIATWGLAREVTGSRRTATVASLLVAVSPAFVIYSGEVMTDVPSLLLVALALLIHLRAVVRKNLWLMLAGAALLGAGVNVRETTLFYAPWLALAPFVCGWRRGRRELARTALACLVFIIFAFAPFALFFLTNTGGIFRASWYVWRETMQVEAARHPVTARNALPFLFYFFIVGPMVSIALPLAAFREWRERGLTPLLLLAAIGLWANLLLFFNYSTTINWRYFLTGLPALVPLVAKYFMRTQTQKMGNARYAFWSVLLGIAFVTVLLWVYAHPVSKEFVQQRALTKEYRARLALLPRDAVLIAGGQSIAVTYWRGVGAGDWTAIGTGAGWPGAGLVPLIETYLKSGRRVFLDLDPRWWAPCGWQRDETLALIRLEPLFHFRQLTDTIYELRPLDDDAAHDAPDLERLLPQRRPLDSMQCNRLSE